MASKKEIPNIDESMPLLDKNDKNNELAELNKPLILNKEYNSQKELIKKYEKDFTNARQETLKINDVIKDQEQQLKLLYEEKIELNQNTLDFQKNKNQLKSEFIHKQQELIKKYEKEMKEFKNLNQEYNEKIISLENANSDLKNKEEEIKELKNLNQEYNEKIISLEKANSDLKNKEDEIKHYQNDNLRLANQLFETSKKLENTQSQLNKFESNKSQIQEQIHNLNEIISKNNIAKDQIIQFAQNKDTENISKITIKEKPDIELDISSQDLEEKNKDLEEVNEKTKNIFAN